MRKKPEDNYRDPRWQRKRLEIFQRDEFTCQQCGSAENELHVHHIVYKPGCLLWEYDDDSLLTLCSKCHKEYTERVRLIRELMLDAFLVFRLEELEILSGYIKAFIGSSGPPWFRLYIASDNEARGVADFYRVPDKTVLDLIQDERLDTSSLSRRIENGAE